MIITLVNNISILKFSKRISFNKKNYDNMTFG